MTIKKFIDLKSKKKYTRPKKKSSIRALATVELNSYIAILAPPKYKKQPYSNGAKGFFFIFYLFFLPSLQQCITIYSCAL